METVRLYFLGLQNHYRWWCSHEIKRSLLLGRETMTNLDSILKNRDFTLPTKFHLVKVMVLCLLNLHWALLSLVAQMVKHLPTMWETQVQSLGREDLLEKKMATHSSILAWKIPRTEEPGWLLSMGSQRVGHD